MYDVEKYIINFLELFKMKIEHEQKHEEASSLKFVQGCTIIYTELFIKIEETL